MVDVNLAFVIYNCNASINGFMFDEACYWRGHVWQTTANVGSYHSYIYIKPHSNGSGMLSVQQQTSLTHTTLTHTALTRTALTHTTLTHTALTHTSLTHTALTRTPLTHTALTHSTDPLQGFWTVSPASRSPVYMSVRLVYHRAQYLVGLVSVRGDKGRSVEQYPTVHLLTVGL